MSRKVIVSVSNDLVSDQRVHKTCMSLLNSGWDVLLVGRQLPHSPVLGERKYQTKRLNLLFTSGPLFYISLNLRLFLLLLCTRCTVMHSNDLDTLLPNYLAAKIRGKKLVYDSHEYFTEVPELVNRPRVQKIWKTIERFIVPQLTHCFTVNDSIANLFERQYNVKFKVLQNVPLYQPSSDQKTSATTVSDQKIILLQGAGINIDRGAEELVQAMQLVDQAVLYIVGSGDVIPFLKQECKRLNLDHKVVFFDRLPFEKLKTLTHQAYFGLTLDKNTNINYEFSLPNKLFDYLHAGIPVLASNLIEVAKVVKHYQVGKIVPDHQPETIAKSINDLLNDEQEYLRLRGNCQKAARELNWENEEKKLISTYSSFLEK